jgi:integrase
MHAMTSHDRRRVVSALAEWARSGSIVGLRTQAMVTLTADTGLRAIEVTRLNVDQVLERRADYAIATRGHLRPAQAKGKVGGPFVISARARRALAAYLRAAVGAGWLTWPAPRGTPLFIGHRGHAGAAGHGRLTKRSAQHCWHEAQRRADLSARYGFHALRHDAATRIRAAGGDVLDVKHCLRLRSVQYAARYCDQIDANARGAELVARAARL